MSCLGSNCRLPQRPVSPSPNSCTAHAVWVTPSGPRSRSTSGVLLSTRGVVAWVALWLLTFTGLCLALMLKKEGPKECREWSSHRDGWRLVFCLCQQGSD